ncbi:hypothetical protein [Limnoglobus roseus]|uniref:hypothetical protein n=1 Tax=Limnoglobus roseus TaxID=2598579 RepID=UPI0011EA8A8A|nr:hypothetical protein [Limnoglobus roseus]
MPTTGAKLVKYDTGWAGVDENLDRLPNYFSLAFEIAPASKTQGTVLLIGTATDPAGKYRFQAIKPAVEAMKELRSNETHDLIYAVQCQICGWDKLAAFLFERSQKEAEQTPQKQLLDIAWSYWVDQITVPKIDRTTVFKRLKGLIARDKDFDTEANRALLHSLELALVPSTSKPGSVEALIDDLVDDPTDTGSGFLSPHERSNAFAKIAVLGFDAVPTLIDHLDDDRLTRSMSGGFNNFRSWNLRVKDRIGDLIENLAAEELERGDGGKDIGKGWLPRQQGWPIKKAAAEKWWAGAKKAGEESYLLSRVFPPKRNDGRVRINDHALLVLEIKYPKQIVTLYQTVLEKRADLHIWDLAEIISRSKMTDAEKQNLFRLAADHRDLRTRYIGLYHLAKLDNKVFTTILLDTLEHLPTDVTEKYWWCREAEFTKLAVETDDPRIWPVLEKVIARSSLGLKMEMLKGLTDSTDKRHRGSRLRLLAQYLDDETVRDEKMDQRFDGPGAGFPYRKIEVRNFVTVEIAGFYDLKIEDDNKRSADEWAKLRDQVRKRLKQEFGG